MKLYDLSMWQRSFWKRQDFCSPKATNTHKRYQHLPLSLSTFVVTSKTWVKFTTVPILQRWCRKVVCHLPSVERFVDGESLWIQPFVILFGTHGLQTSWSYCTLDKGSLFCTAKAFTSSSWWYHHIRPYGCEISKHLEWQAILIMSVQ